MSAALALTRGDIADYVAALLFVYLVLIIANVVLSLGPAVPADPLQPDAARGDRLHRGDAPNPYLNLFRRFVPRIGPLDISPILAILVLSIVGGIVVGLIRG